MNDMWTELERYQPYADKHGFGDAWREMTENQTAFHANIAAHEAMDWAFDACDWMAACAALLAARSLGERPDHVGTRERVVQAIQQATRYKPSEVIYDSCSYQ